MRAIIIGAVNNDIVASLITGFIYIVVEVWTYVTSFIEDIFKRPERFAGLFFIVFYFYLWPKYLKVVDTNHQRINDKLDRLMEEVRDFNRR